MAKSSSTRFKDLRGRPSDYRTPSPPPRSAIEDIPPLTPPTQGIFNTSFVRTKLNGRTKRGADDSHKRLNYRTPSPPPRSAIEAISPLTSARSTADASASDAKTKNRRIAQSVKKGRNKHGGRERIEKKGPQDGSRWNTRGGGDETEGEDESSSTSKGNGDGLAMDNDLTSNKSGVDYHTSSQSTHQFSSAMDAIATIAMATSPTFGPQSHQLPSAFLQSQYPSQYPASQFVQLSTPTWSDERPAKRARSDYPPDASAYECQRPQISYNNPATWAQSYPQQSMWDNGAGSASPVSQRRQTTVTDSDAELLLNVGRVAVFAKPIPAKQLESDENGRLDMALASHPGDVIASFAGENSSFRSAGKPTESELVLHHQPDTTSANGVNPTHSEAQDPSVRSPCVPCEKQNLSNISKYGGPLGANEVIGTGSPPFANADQSGQTLLPPTIDSSTNDLGQGQSGWRLGWFNGISTVGRQSLEELPGGQGTPQTSHLGSSSRSISPIAGPQRTYQEETSQQVTASRGSSELATGKEHGIQDAIPISPPRGDVVNGVETSGVDVTPLPREPDIKDGIRMASAGAHTPPSEHDVVDNVDAASADLVSLAKEQSPISGIRVVSTETVFLPPKHDMRAKVKATMIADVPLPQERDVVDKARTTLAEAVVLSNVHGMTDSVEAPSVEPVHLPRGHNRVGIAEIPSVDAVLLPEEREVMGIVQVTSGGVLGLREKCGRAAGAEGALAEAATLPKECQAINDVGAAVGETDSSSAEQRSPVNASLGIRGHTQMSEKPTEFLEPDHKVTPSPAPDNEGIIVPKTQNILDDGGQGFIQELRDYVKRSAGENVGARDTGTPVTGATHTTNLIEQGNVIVEGRSNVVESVPPQAIPADSSHMVRGESQSSESRNSSKQPRRGWPKGKPRGPRSSWPGVIKAKEGIRADGKPGSLSRANRSAGRKENQIEVPNGSGQSVHKNQHTEVIEKTSIEDVQHEILTADSRRRTEDANDADSSASVDTRVRNIASRHPSSSNKTALAPAQDTHSRHSSSPPLGELHQGGVDSPASASLQDSPMVPVHVGQVPQQVVVTVSLPSAPDSGEVQGSVANIGAPTLSQTSPNRQTLRHRYSAPDMLTDPLTTTTPSEGQDTRRINVPQFTRALSTPLGCGQGSTGQNPETKENALGQGGAGEGTEQSICAGCSMLPNSLGGDNYLETISWIKCDGCRRWFHYACAGFTEKEVRSVDKFNCQACWEKCGPTTFVRKSSRAHTSIDYAGLHEGVVKTSEESLDHPYVKPIKDGTTKFLPESFTRIRPELATREFFEKNGMKEPVVIPGFMNPRPDSAPDVDKLCCDHSEGESQVFIKQAIDYWLAGDFDKLHGPNRGQDAMDMVIPQNLTVRKVAQLYGPGEKVEVINVKSQGEDGPWNMKKWADYYESKDKQFIRNVISLEISTSELGRLVKRPQVVRDMDLADSVWPTELRAKGDFPKVQLYCLMSVENSFTDFHIDFGGSSVFYHILKGKKTFLFIPPKPKHLKKYEQWCLSPAQNQTFLPDQTKECIRVDLAAGDTMLIPSGWIHAVWTPEDSLVIGGNFLTRMHYGMQIAIAEIEKNTKVPRKFRYPSFQRVLWFTAIRYLQDDPIPTSLVERFNDDGVYKRGVPLHQDFNSWGANAMGNPEAYNARHYSQAELDGLPSLVGYLLRSALISMGKITEGITVDTRQRVARAMPKGYGEPLELAKTFAMWSAWKRGNEMIPHWAYRDAIPGEGIAGVGEKKLSAAAIKRLEKEAAAQEKNAPPGRQSMRKRAQIEAAALNETKSATPEFGSSTGSPLTEAVRKTIKPPLKIAGEKRARAATATGLWLGDVDGSLVPIKPVKTPKTSVLGPKRVACDECRKRRVRCKHKDLLEPDEPEIYESSKTRNTTPRSEACRDVAHSAQSLTDANPLNRSPTDQGIQQAQVPITLGPPAGTLTQHQQAPVGTLSTTPAPSGPGGKHRACERCRKNRRRCIHDGNGNVDPIKAQEPPMPRASSVNKRTRPNVGLDTNRYFKKTKIEPEIANGFDNISEGLTDVIRVRPTIPDPLRSFDLSRQHTPRGQRPIGGSADRRALDIEQRHPRVPVVLPGTWEYPLRQETSGKPSQQPPSVPTVLVDASERQLLREEAYRNDKVSTGDAVQVVIRNGIAATPPKISPQVPVPTLPPANHIISNVNTNLPGAVLPISTSPVDAAATAKANPSGTMSQQIGSSPWGSNKEIESCTRVEQEQTVSDRTEAALIASNSQEMEIGNVEADHEMIERRRVESTCKEIDMELIDPQLRGLQIDHTERGLKGLEANRIGPERTGAGTAQAEPEHQEMGARLVRPEHAAIEIVKSVPENLGPIIGPVPFGKGETEMKPVDQGQREVGTSTTPEHNKTKMDQIEPEGGVTEATQTEPGSVGKGKEQTRTDGVDVGPVDSHQPEPKLRNEMAQTQSISPNRIEQVSSQPGVTEHVDARWIEFGQSHSAQMEPESMDLSGMEVEQSSPEKMEFELESSIDDLSSPPDSPLSELDISSPEPDSEIKPEPQTKPKPQTTSPPQEQRRRSKRETKEVQRFSVAGTTGSHTKHHAGGREASRTPAPATSHKSMSPSLEFPSPGKTYARKPGRPVITPCKTAPLSRPGSIFAAGDDSSLVAQGANRGKTPFPEGESAADEEKASEVDEESWRLAKEMEFGLRRKGLK
ncbi:MAG: JmjC domain-containing histone demethylation protein 1 [Geoglossum simile]|nr:MAG: JmjC domain-containing histone demethylation protein 1 [Geoglossum simile]